MDQTDPENRFFSYIRTLFRLLPMDQIRSGAGNPTSGMKIEFKTLLFCPIFVVGIPPSLIFLRPTRLPGRFILSPYRIVFFVVLLCAMVAAALGAVGRTGPSMWVGIVGSGILGLILFFLKEHRDDFPDFAPWFFDTDCKAICGVAVLLLFQLGITRLPAILYLDGLYSPRSRLDWKDNLLFSLVVSGEIALPLRLAWAVLKSGQPQNPLSTLLIEEILALGSHFAGALFVYLESRIDSAVPFLALAVVIESSFCATLFLVDFLECRFEDTFARAAASYKRTFGIQDDF